MASVRKRAGAAVERAGLEQTRLHPAGQLFWREGLLGDVAEVDGLVGANDGESAALERDIVLVRLHERSAELPALGEDLVCGQQQRRSPRHHAARAEGAGADGYLVG